MLKKILTVSITLFMLLTLSTYVSLTERTKRKPQAERVKNRTKFHKLPNAVEGIYVVMLENEVSRSRISEVATALTQSYGGEIEYVYKDVIKGFAVKGMTQPQAIALSRDPMVRSVEEAARAVHTGQQAWPSESTQVKPLDRIDQRNGFDGFYTYPRTGTGVHVYVVDTGVWIRHNDFGGRASATFDFDPATSAAGFGTGTASDNHGTLSASYIGSKNFGVAKNCLLHSVRVDNFNGPGRVGNSGDFVAGLDAILNEVNSKGHLPAVVNISLGFFTQLVNPAFGSPISPNEVTSVENAVTSLLNAGITVVAGAGNFNTSTSTFTPARMPRVLTVGGSYGIPGPSEDSRAFYFCCPQQASNFGADLYAPSGGVLNGQSWFVRGDASNTDYGIEGEFGTSAAAPHAAGAAALYLEQFSLDPLNALAQPDQVELQIKSNASPSSLPILYVGCEFISAPTANPIDTTRIFVRQHYYDFLNRQPDESGWNFWSGTIDTCGTDQNCIHVKRVNASRAFFESIEFKETGYYVYRLNKISFSTFTGGNNFTGPNPRMEDFFVDQKKIGNGVIVGQPGWDQLLEQNKVVFAEEWVNRPRFLSEYQGLSNDQFVDKLYATAQVSDPATRNAMVTGLNNFTETRATVVKKIAESNAINNNQQGFINPAYVLMQYFGYLRRNPDDVPDGNLDGYTFWLTDLNNGTKNSFEMVDAFISSIEYRARFFNGPFCN
jgi:subtilisin family serine protease